MNNQNPLLANGFTVRATAIAQWSPITTARFNSSFNLTSSAAIQFASFALTDQFWMQQTDLDQQQNGQSTWTTAGQGTSNVTQSATFNSAEVFQITPLTTTGLTVIGQTVTPTAGPPATNQGFAPVIQQGTNLLIGFGYVSISGNTITRFASNVHAYQNASASFSLVMPGDTLPAQAEIAGAVAARSVLTLDSTTALRRVATAFLLSAPALVRSMP
jgi:hypothetical protein